VLRQEVAAGRVDYLASSRRYRLNGGLPADVRLALRELELAADGHGPEDVAIAQLHYTLLLHLGGSGNCSTRAPRSRAATYFVGRASIRATSSRASRA